MSRRQRNQRRGNRRGQRKRYKNQRPKKKVSRAKPKQKKIKKEVEKLIDFEEKKPMESGLASLGSIVKPIIPGVADTISDLFAGISGFGAYEIKSNTLMGQVGDLGHTDPGIFGSDNGSVVITHREFIGSLSTSSDGSFKNTAYNLTPLNPSLFPYTRNIAAQYDIWVPLGIIFEFKSTASVSIASSTAVAMGSLIMTTQYNVLDSGLSNKIDMMQYQWTTQGKISEDLIHPIECDPMESPLGGKYYTLVNSGANKSFDPRFATMGVFNIATAGTPAATNVIGDLWVTYQFKFMKPRKPSAVAFADHYQLNTDASTSAYFGSTLPTSVAGSNFGTTLTNTTIVLPSWFSGNVSVNWTLGGSSTAYTLPTLTGTNGVSALNLYASDGFNVAGNNNTGTTMAATWYFQVSNPTLGLNTGGQPTITFSLGTLVTSSTTGDLIISVIPISA